MTKFINDGTGMDGAVRGAGCGVRGAGCGVRGAGCGVRGAGCGVRGAGCGVRGAGCGVRGAVRTGRKLTNILHQPMDRLNFICRSHYSQTSAART